MAKVKNTEPTLPSTTFTAKFAEEFFLRTEDISTLNLGQELETRLKYYGYHSINDLVKGLETIHQNFWIGRKSKSTIYNKLKDHSVLILSKYGLAALNKMGPTLVLRTSDNRRFARQHSDYKLEDSGFLNS